MKRILFVDDEIKILDGIRRTLHAERMRWEMEFATSGEDALEACDRRPFDVVISDMRMPGMDGATLLSHIRDRFPGTARIVLSGHCETEAVARAIPVAHRFLAKPCNVGELQVAIERACTLQELLHGPKIRGVIGSVGELPSLSSTYSSLEQALRNGETPIVKIAEIIERDMAMTAKILQLVNSAFFGLAQKMTSLRSAVSYLGMDTIKNLVLVADVFGVLVPDKRIPQSAYQSLQKHAHRTAAIAGRLPLHRKSAEWTILAALLHDIGTLILACKMPDEYCSVLALASERGCQLFEAEEEILGTSHAEIGAYLLGLWGLPHEAVEAIAHHHHPTRIPHSGFDISIALYLASLLASESVVADQPKVELRESDRSALELLGVLPHLAEFRELALSCE